VPQSCALKKLHSDEGMSVLLANVIDRANVGMVQSRCCLGFTLKTAEGLGISGDVIREEFQRDN
jgi:hypothetical protein